MDIAAIVVQELAQFFLEKGLVGGYHVAQALISKLKAHFAKDKEATEALDKLQQSPDNQEIEQAFKTILSDRLKANPLLATELQTVPGFPRQLLTVADHGQVEDLTGTIEGQRGEQNISVTGSGIAKHVNFGIKSDTRPNP